MTTGIASVAIVLLVWEVIVLRRRITYLEKWRALHTTELERVNERISGLTIKIIEVRDANTLR